MPRAWAGTDGSVPRGGTRGHRLAIASGLALVATLALTSAASAALTAQPVADINPGPSGSNPSWLTALGGHLYFSADEGHSGRELWRTDGTTSELVKDIRPGTESSVPNRLTALGGHVYFWADDGASGRELWRSDGTAAGTALVADINPGPADASPFGNETFVPFDGFLYFSANDGTNGRELWRTNGTTTELVKDINPGGDSFPDEMTALGGFLYFSATDGATGVELWRTDGSGPGTVLWADINPGIHSSPRELSVVGNEIYFQANDGLIGAELWRTDGVTTTNVADINPGVTGSFPRGMTALGGQFYFEAATAAIGTELWRSDGTLAGTLPVADINPTGNSSPSGLTPFGSHLYFRADDGTAGRELWRTDGATATLIADIAPGSLPSDPGGFTEFGGLLFFSATPGETFADSRREELFSTDGSTTAVFAEILPGSDGSDPLGFTAFSAGLYFSAEDGTTGRELWRIADVPPDTGLSFGIAKRKLKLSKKRTTTVRLGCPAAETSGPCDGTLRLKTRKKIALAGGGAGVAQKKGKSKRRKQTLAKSGFSIAAGEARKIKLKLSKRHAKLIRSNRQARKVLAVAKVADQAGNSATVKRKLSIVPGTRKATKG